MSSPTPPTTPRGGSKWGSRLGAAVRRSSTLLTLSRPTTPSPADRDSDTASLRRSTSREAIPASTPSLSTSKLAAAPTASKQGVPPTPIAESPAREDAATQQEAAAATGPSPLANADNQITASPEPAPFVPAALAEEAATSPVGYVPPPVIDSSAGNPGAFTDDPEALPQPDVVKDPYAASNTGPPPPSDAVEEASALAEREVAAEPAPTTEYVPPPVVDSAAANPGAYTDQATELPQPTVAHDPFAEGVAAPVPVAASEPAIMLETHAPEPEEHPQPVAPPMEQSSSYFEDKPMAESMLEYDPAADAPVPVEFAQAVEEHAPVAMPAAAASSDDVFGPVLAVGTAHAVVEEAHHEEDERRPEDREGEAAEYYRTVGPAMPIAEPHQPSEQHQQHPPAEPTPAHAAEESRAAPTFGTGTVYDYLPEYMSPDIWGGAQRGQGGEGSRAHNVWASASTMPAARHEAQGGEEGKAYTGTQPIPIPVPVVLGGAAAASVGNGHGNGGAHSYSESYKMPNPHPEVSYTEDPFADPAPPHVAGHSHPEIAPQPQVMPVESHDDARGVVTMPLPAFHDVVPQPIQAIPSQQSSFGGSRMPQPETSERMPLLGRPGTPKKTSYANTPANHASISPLTGVGASTSWNPHGVAHQPRLHELGWLEYHLPDGGVYFVHPTRNVTTDANLRVDRVLSAVEAWLDARGDEVFDVGVEAWLRQGKGVAPSKGMWSGKKTQPPAVELERYWVDHHARTVVRADGEDRRVTGYTRGHIRGNGGHGKGKQVGSAAGPQSQEDQLDLEYRFWSFMEAHPAHHPLPHKAKSEAMDVLTWAWTDRLLPSARPIPPPFTQDECQELMTLLRSFNNEGQHDDHGIQTRVVARILLRVAQWRQTYFRPNKPLPKDVNAGPNELTTQRRPIRRALFDFVVSCLCLGIPYLFLERARLSARGDSESGAFRSNSVIIIGACTCLVAAIVLSASVTFLSLPGLDNVARTAGMVAVVFATFSLVATGVAILRHKTDLERPISLVGIEGLMVISRRTVALSLPMVFLAYALIGVITGLILYTFRGAPIGSPSPGGKSSFEDYVRWSIVGVVGALAGIMTTSLLVLR